MVPPTKQENRTWAGPAIVLANEKTLLTEQRTSGISILAICSLLVVGPLAAIFFDEAKNVLGLLVMVLLGAAGAVYGVYQLGLRKLLTLEPERGFIEELSGRFTLDERTQHQLHYFDQVTLTRRLNRVGKRGRSRSYYYDVFLAGPDRTLKLGVYGRENSALDAAIHFADLLRVRLIDSASIRGQHLKLPYESIRKLEAHPEASTSWWLRPSIISIAVANLVPIAGVFMADWEIFPIMLFYWLENFAIMTFSVAGIFWAERAQVSEKINLSLISLGMFAVLQGILGFLILFIFERELLRFTPSELMNVIPEMYGTGLLIGVVAMFISHGTAFFTVYVKGCEYKLASVVDLSFKAIASVVLMQVVMFIGAFMVDRVDSPQILLVLLVLAKTATSIFSEVKAYRRHLLKDYFEAAGVA